MTAPDLRIILDKDHLDACADAQEWAEDHDGTVSEAYDQCPRGDWLLWLAVRLSVDRRLVVKAACDCASLALHHVHEDEERPGLALDLAERWANGDEGVSLAEVIDAGDRATDACHDSSYAASSAAFAASSAADSAYVGATLHSDAADAGGVASAVDDAAADAAAFVYGDVRAARERTRGACADLVRKHIPWDVVARALSATLDAERGEGS